MCYDWPVNGQYPIRMKGNPKCTSSNSLSPLGVQNTEFGGALQTLVTELDYVCNTGHPDAVYLDKSA